MIQEDVFVHKLEEIKTDLLNFAHSLLGDKHSAEDALQEATIKMINNKEKFKTGKLKHWANTILRNHCVDIIRSRNKYGTKVVYIPSYFDYVMLSEDENDDTEEKLVKMHIAIKTLPNRSQQILNLVLKGKKYTEIGRILNISEGNVKAITHRSKIKLKKILLN